MLKCYIRDAPSAPIKIKPIITHRYTQWIASQNPRICAWAEACGFKADPDTLLQIPSENNELDSVLLGVSDLNEFRHYGSLPARLSAGNYYLDKTDFEHVEQWHRALLGWGLGSYQYTTYYQRPLYTAQLWIPPEVDYARLEDWISTIYFVRDLINTPAEDMGPPELAAAVKQVARSFDAQWHVWVGDELLAKGFSATHIVGRAGSRPPHWIDMTWGDARAPKVTLVGKGVCFDSGGLDLKTETGMRLMKKDMGGAAHALGLARMVMAQGLPIRLRLLIPAVENAVGSQSYRPGDVLRVRGRCTVEIGNTDAEGRLVVGEALAEAVTEKPELLFDFATLTGAARVALGPDLPVLFTHHERLASELLAAAQVTQDPMWRLPLYAPYNRYLKSEVAELSNESTIPMAGAITAALFLQRFVPTEIPWAHWDLFAWNVEPLPARPVGGEAQALRAVFHYLEKKFGTE
ncbi:MAG: leucyl aminopeptidase [Coxiella sp. RIFCSPHIGHO2_12_FULL_44_14]|nr:MAG: leucyl aminopeptidase [Coxiella sp. RIFCSPHIGHO2_12_FULL_44_14]